MARRTTFEIGPLDGSGPIGAWPREKDVVGGDGRAKSTQILQHGVAHLLGQRQPSPAAALAENAQAAA